MKTTIIKAYDNEDKSTPQSINIFIAVHRKDVIVEDAIKAAFKEWAKTPEGEEFIDENGTNWGDATDIPNKFLKKHGIKSFGRNEETVEREIIVDHNENLVD